MLNVIAVLQLLLSLIYVQKQLLRDGLEKMANIVSPALKLRGIVIIKAVLLTNQVALLLGENGYQTESLQIGGLLYFMQQEEPPVKGKILAFLLMELRSTYSLQFEEGGSV